MLSDGVPPMSGVSCFAGSVLACFTALSNEAL